jgi:predicted ribosomally synthesized peptide with SipW-like signal peptide
MKNIVLSMVVIGALVAAALGGTLAGFSDTEESVGNRLQVGSLDLKISQTSDGTWLDDPDIQAVIDGEFQPCKSNDFSIFVKNIGQPAGDLCDLWMKVKDVECFNVTDKAGQTRPEPEVVSEDGGWLAQKYVNGIGQQGDNCNLDDFINIIVYYPYDPNNVPKPAYNGPISGLTGNMIELGALNKCEGPKEIKVTIHFPNISEDTLATLLGPDPYFAGVNNDGDAATDEDPRNGLDDDNDGLIDEDPDADDDPATTGVDEGGHFDRFDTDTATLGWNDWPTNAFMKDKITFNILFALEDVQR